MLVSVMGMSGSGKSTLLKCIAGLIKPASGHIYLGDIDIVPLPERRLAPLRRNIGMVFQYAALFDSMTVYDNVAFGVRRHFPSITKPQLDEIVSQNLRRVGLDGIGNLMPSQLSGGMQKRVGIARALATNPRVLLYDEPTSGLDPITARVIDDLALGLKNDLGVTTVVVSHNLASVFRISDKVAMLSDGRIVECGPPEQIRNSSNPAVRQFVEGTPHGPLKVVG